LNGISQGIAFRNLEGAVHAAVSVTGTDIALSLVPADISKVDDYRSLADNRVMSMNRVINELGNVWDPSKSSKNLLITEDCTTVLNTGSNNKWRTVASLLPYSSGRRYFEILIKELPNSSNSWKICIGVVPKKFDFGHKKLWVGAQGSYGYIGGTGGKCHDQSKSISYGAKYGKGDKVGVLLDFDNHTVEFFKNGVNQGVAFEDLSGPVFAAVSITSTQGSASIDGICELNPEYIDRLILYK